MDLVGHLRLFLGCVSPHVIPVDGIGQLGLIRGCQGCDLHIVINMINPGICRRVSSEDISTTASGHIWAVFVT
jgi:hypothetical protein